ncbi:NADH-quinone oxidoreductase subunit B family protein [Persephonella sp.]
MIFIGVFKFASCDGCQLAFFDISDRLLKLDIKIEYFLEAQSENIFNKFDIAFVEGSISTPQQEEKIKEIRKKSKKLITIGACADSGGIQSIRNFMDYEDVLKHVYPSPEYIKSLEKSKPISDYVEVDFEIRGCPINKEQLYEVIISVLMNKTPSLPEYPVCLECKRKGNPCVLILGQPCLGSIIKAGCGAICPSFNRGCYGCFGPIENPNIDSLREIFEKHGYGNLFDSILTSFNAYNKTYREKYEKEN